MCFSSVGCLCNHWPFMFNLTHSCINVVTCTWCFVCDNWITMRITPSKLMFLRYKSSKDRWWQEHAGDKCMSACSTLLFCTFTNNRVATTCIYDILSSDVNAPQDWKWNEIPRILYLVSISFDDDILWITDYVSWVRTLTWMHSKYFTFILHPYIPYVLNSLASSLNVVNFLNFLWQ